MKTIKQVSKLTGASVRTLQYYDNIHLLTPSRTKASYRLYDDNDIAKLQQILFLKELDFSLKEIRELIDNPQSDQSLVFHRQKEFLHAKHQREQQIIQILDRLANGAALDECADDIKTLAGIPKTTNKFTKLCLILVPIFFATGVIYIYQIAHHSDNPDFSVLSAITTDVININPLQLTGSVARDLALRPIDSKTLPANAPVLANIHFPVDLQNDSIIQGLFSRTDSNEYDHLVNYIIVSRNDMRSVYISFSADREPIRELYTPSGEVSIINGHEVLISHCIGEVYISERDISEPIENYYIDFSVNNLNYNIETHGLSESEAVTLLKSLL